MKLSPADHVSTDEGKVADSIIFNGRTLKGPAEIFHHAAGGSAASMSELSLVLQERAATALPELCTQVGFVKAVSHYDLLGVRSDASSEEIKNAFFDKSKKLHPDSDPSNPALHNQFVELNEAYRVLSKELSRKDYDLKIRHPYSGGQAFRSTSSHTSSRASTYTNENQRYREQFRQSQAQEMTAEEWQRRRRRNFHLVGYCFLTMVLSIGAHVIFFRKLEEVHNNFMDEKDRLITDIYNESKERAKINGFKKQSDILRQKHAEFLEKYNISNDREDK